MNAATREMSVVGQKQPGGGGRISKYYHISDLFIAILSLSNKKLSSKSESKPGLSL